MSANNGDLRAQLRQRAESLGMTAGEVARRSCAAGGQVTRQHLHEVLAGRAHLSTAKLGPVLDALGLVVTAKK